MNLKIIPILICLLTGCSGFGMKSLPPGNYETHPYQPEPVKAPAPANVHVVIAPKEWLPEARDAAQYDWATNRTDLRFAKPSVIHTATLRSASLIELPSLTEAVTPIAPPDLMTLAWDAPKAAISYRLYTNGAIFLNSISANQVTFDDMPARYQVSAISIGGLESAKSLALVYPKPTTNIMIWSSSIPEWSRSWTNQATAQAHQFFRVLYEVLPSGTNRASVVYASEATAPTDTNHWQTFTLFPSINTTDRNIELYWRQETL